MSSLALGFRGPPTQIVTIMDNKGCIRVLLYSEYTTMQGGPHNVWHLRRLSWGSLLGVFITRIIIIYWGLYSGLPIFW